MRDGILDQLPKTLAKDQLVMVFGASEFDGQNHVKSLINDLNRNGDWIRGEFVNQFSSGQVPQRAAVILTMSRLSHGVLTNIRRAATGENRNICCPNQALTVGEVKEILRHFANIRGKDVSVLPGSHNGNGNHRLPSNDEAQRLEELAKFAKQTSKTFTDVLNDPPTNPEQLEPPVPTTLDVQVESSAPTNEDSVPPEIESALTAIKKLQSTADEVQLALLVASDKLKAGSMERIEFEKRLALKDELIAVKNAENAELRAQLETRQKVAEENELLHKKNESLESEIHRLSNALDQFDQMIKSIRQK